MDYKEKTDEKLNMSLLLDFYGDILTERQKEIACLSFEEDLSLREISELTGITPQGVGESLKKSKAVLADMEKKLGLLSIFSQKKAAADLMLERLEKIKEKAPELAEEIDGVIEIAKKILE